MSQLKYFTPFRTQSISSSLQAIRILRRHLTLLSPLILSTFGFARRILITCCRKRTAESKVFISRRFRKIYPLFFNNYYLVLQFKNFKKYLIALAGFKPTSLLVKEKYLNLLTIVPQRYREKSMNCYYHELITLTISLLLV